MWGYKELRRTLEKDGWQKTDFMVNLNPPNNNRANGGYEDSTLPLIDKGWGGWTACICSIFFLFTYKTYLNKMIYSLSHRGQR